MSNIHKYKKFDFVLKRCFSLSWWYRVLIIDNPEFRKYISDIYPTELQVSKAYSSDEETAVLDFESVWQ